MNRPRKSPGQEMVDAVRDCTYCEGVGCSECDGTGKKVRTALDLGDGAGMTVSGSRPLTPEDAEALVAIGQVAIEKMAKDREQRGGLRGLTTCPRCGEEFSA